MVQKAVTVLVLLGVLLSACGSIELATPDAGSASSLLPPSAVSRTDRMESSEDGHPSADGGVFDGGAVVDGTGASNASSDALDSGPAVDPCVARCAAWCAAGAQLVVLGCGCGVCL